MTHVLNDSVNLEIINDIREIYANATHKELRDLIASHFIPTEKEKKSHAEIPTPPKLVNEMLEKIPHEFWTHPHKVFEPCCGKGNFVIGIFDRFFNGLEKEIPDKFERCHVIMDYCLYYADINPLNVFITTEIMKCHVRYHGGVEAIDYPFNSYVGDTLKLDIGKQWKLKGFDAVIGNPPYQEIVGVHKTETMWNKFVIKSLGLLNLTGYMALVHPSGWRNIEGKFKNIQKELLSHDLLYLEIHNEKDGLKMFNTETRYDWYVLHNQKVIETHTTINFEDKIMTNINVINLEFIPNSHFDEVYSLLATNGDTVKVIHDYSLYETRKKWMSKTQDDSHFDEIKSLVADKDENRVNLLYSASLYHHQKKWMSKNQDDEFIYPCVYTVNSKSEPTFYYSSIQHGHFGIPKLIWSNGRITSVGSYIDDHGDYGLTQFAYAIVDEPYLLPLIKKAFDSKNFREIMGACAVGQLSINHKVISLFKKDFWKYFI